MTAILSIDPGKTGALAIFKHGELDAIADMPDTTAGLQDLLMDLPPLKCAVVEKAYAGTVAGPRQIATTFQRYGALLASLQWRDIPIQEVQPAAWKKALGLGKDKAASREMASQMFPSHAELFRRVKDDGRAEAALIGAYWMGKGK